MTPGLVGLEGVQGITRRPHLSPWCLAPPEGHPMPPRLVPVTDLKRKATEIIQALQLEQEPLLITEGGREAAILMDVTSYRRQERKVELLEGIIRGRKALTEGKTQTHAEVLVRTARWT